MVGRGTRLAPLDSTVSPRRGPTPRLWQMNAHHRKASYRPPPPSPDTRTYKAGLAPAAATLTSTLTRAIRRVPYGWQVRILSQGPIPRQLRSPLYLLMQLDAVIPHDQDDHADADAVVSALQGIAQATGSAQLALGVNLAHLLDLEFLNLHIRQGQPRDFCQWGLSSTS